VFSQLVQEIHFCCSCLSISLIVVLGIGKKLHGFVERTARACAAAGEIENSSSSSSSSNHTSILHPVEEFLRALVNPAGVVLNKYPKQNQQHSHCGHS
jgi:hypothetical protein